MEKRLLHVDIGFILFLHTILTVTVVNSQWEEYLSQTAAKETVEKHLDDAWPHLIEPEVLDPHNLSTSEYTFLYVLPTDPAEYKGLSFIISPCSGIINWSLNYRNADGKGQPALNKTEFDHEQFQYRGSETSVYHMADVSKGLFSIRISASSNQSSAIIFFTFKPDVLPFIKSVQLQNRRRIRVKKIFKRSSVKLEWTGFEPFNMFLEYLVVVNTRKSYSSLCEAYGDTKPTDPDNSCSAHNNSDVMCYSVNAYMNTLQLNLKLGENYYVDVFVQNITGVSIPYAHTRFEFVKFKPLPLHDGQLAKANITMNGGKISYQYKMREIRTADELQIYVIPCSQITVEIRQDRRRIIKEKIEFFTTFKLPNPTLNSRYVIKIIDESKGKDLDYEMVEVYATINSKNFLPHAPEQTELLVNTSTVCDSSGLIRADISWERVKSNHTLRYVLSVKDKFGDRVIGSNRKFSRNSQHMTYKLPLKPDQEYLIQLKVGKIGSNLFMPYKMYNLRTFACNESLLQPQE